MDHQDSIQTRLRDHVKKRGNPSIPNGAWNMMLEAADRIDQLETQITELGWLVSTSNESLREQDRLKWR